MITSKFSKVVIVGGGASGIAAAARLMEGGIQDFVVLEAGAEIGGRLKAEGFGGGKVEMGAQWIHGNTNNIVHEMAQSWGIISEQKSINEEDARFVTSNGEELPEETVNEFIKISSTIQENLKKIKGQENKFPSQGEFYKEMIDKEFATRHLDKEMSNLGRDYMGWFSKLQASIDGSASLFGTALENESVYQECEGDQSNKFKAGIVYQDFLNRLAHGLQDNTILGEKVTKIVRKKEDVEIVLESGIKLKCKYVIVTVSLGVLKHDYKELFEPPLPPSKIAAIKHMGFGTVAKVFVEYPTDWFNIDQNASEAGYSFIRRKEGEWRNAPDAPWEDSAFGLYPDDHNARVMVIWLSGPAANSVESIPPPLLLEQVHSLIFSFLSPHIANLPRPVAVLSTSWHSDPLCRGSYSFLASQPNPVIRQQGIDEPVRPVDIIEELSKPVDNLLFAGEATHPHYFSTVHGAVESGRREAERLLQLLSL